MKKCFVVALVGLFCTSTAFAGSRLTASKTKTPSLSASKHSLASGTALSTTARPAMNVSNAAAKARIPKDQPMNYLTIGDRDPNNPCTLYSAGANSNYYFPQTAGNVTAAVDDVRATGTCLNDNVCLIRFSYFTPGGGTNTSNMSISFWRNDGTNPDCSTNVPTGPVYTLSGLPGGLQTINATFPTPLPTTGPLPLWIGFGFSIPGAGMIITGAPPVVGSSTRVGFYSPEPPPCAFATFGSTGTTRDDFQFTLIGEGFPVLRWVKDYLLVGCKDVPYADGLGVAGGAPPYTVTVNGTLPAGISVNSGTGDLTGTPTECGIWKFDLVVVDSDAPPSTVTCPVKLGIECETVKDLLPMEDPDGSSFGSQDFEAVNNAFDDYVADDFSVSEDCTISSVSFYYLSSLGLEVPQWRLSFYNDAAGCPAQQQPGANLHEETPLGTDQNVFWSPGASPIGLDMVTIFLSSPLALSAGTYHVGLQAIAPFGTHGQYYVTTTDPNLPLCLTECCWTNPGNGFGTGQTTWGPGLAVFGVSSDLAMRIKKLPTGGGCCPCDVNCDGFIDGDDIAPFVSLLVSGPPGCSPCAGDVNDDTLIDGDDIAPFVSALVSGICPNGTCP